MQVSSIEALVQLGCEAAVPDSMAQTPLHVAAAEGHMDAIHALVRLVRPSRSCLAGMPDFLSTCSQTVALARLDQVVFLPLLDLAEAAQQQLRLFCREA